MATKAKEELSLEVEEVVEPVFEGSSVHTMVRSISSTAHPLGDTKMIEQVDADVSAWVDRGYRLVNTHYLGREPEGFIVMYVLSK